VRQEGKRVRTASLDARVTASVHASTRVGIVVPKYGRTAVERNRVKRRLRELVRRSWLPTWQTAEPLDVLVRALPAAYTRDHAALALEMAQLGVRVERLRRPVDER
jgi:ribonuclease P protein component